MIDLAEARPSPRAARGREAPALTWPNRSAISLRQDDASSFDHLVGAQQELTWTTQRQITFTSTFQNAITTLTLGFPPSSVSSCTVTRITTLGFFARAFAHSRSIISAFSTSVSRRCMNILHDKWPRGRRTAEHRDELAAPCMSGKQHSERRRGFGHDRLPVATGSPQS